MKKEVAMPNWVELEHDMLQFWKEKNCFHKLLEKNKNGDTFAFLDGPATANNRLGVHHFWGRTLKDIALKYNAMKGKSCDYQNGFDAQGMWVEVNVEKELGLNGKPEIVKYGVDKFTNKCMDRVKFFANEMTSQSIRMGQWMDWDNSYFTNTDENITSIWHFLKTCDNNGWIVKKNRPMVWCPRCGTSLSEHEMAGSYHEVTHTAIFIKLPVIGEDFKMVAWTTTPWTLTANVALAVNPSITYVKVKNAETGEKLVLGKEAMKVLKGKYDVLEEFLGEKLVGLFYETCFPELPEQNFVHKIVPWEDVDSTEGSGVVHIAPGCGAEDFELGKKHELPEICPINEQGEMLDNTGFVAGYKTTEVVDLVVNRLQQDNKLLYSHLYKHSYPYCWRCKTDLVYKLVSTWYIKMDDIRPQLLKAIDDVEFQPAYAKKRMIDWLNNMGDWNISRSRFYGLPLPFYVCEKCGKTHVVGSLNELKQLAVKPELVNKIPNLHRPWIDDIKIKCPTCSEELTRVPEVGDCWLDAGITPFSTKKYFTDPEFFNKNFPSDFTCEMIEQIKLWFYSLLVMSVVLTGRAPYKKITTYQYVLDENGGEFHKSGGNSLDADVVADKTSADTIRYLYAAANPTNDMRFGLTLTEEARRKILGFWNIYSFFNTYAVIDNPDVANFKLTDEHLNATDKWLLESVNTFIEHANLAYSDYKSYLIVKEFEILVDDISNFYIRVNRKRFWKSDNVTDQLTAYTCLYRAIKAVVGVMAPIIPFICDYIWQNLVREMEPNEAESVMLSQFPISVYEHRFESILADVSNVRNVITIAQRLRNEKQIKIKQPLGAMHLMVDNNVKSSVERLDDIVRDELNIKQIKFETDLSKFNTETLTINFKNAGAVLKGEVQKLKTALETLNANIKEKLLGLFHKNKIELEPFGHLDKSLFDVHEVPKQEFLIAKDNNITVVLDTNLTQELLDEGLLREIIRNAQVLRKEANFDIVARVLLKITSNSEDVTRVVKKYEDFIKQEVLAKELNGASFEADMKRDVEVSGKVITIELKSL